MVITTSNTYYHVIDSKLKLYGYRRFKKKVTIFSLKKPKKINTVTN